MRQVVVGMMMVVVVVVVVDVVAVSNVANPNLFNI
jgi:hypothetical protein